MYFVNAVHATLFVSSIYFTLLFPCDVNLFLVNASAMKVIMKIIDTKRKVYDESSIFTVHVQTNSISPQKVI